jgi:hypothetical protein
VSLTRNLWVLDPEERRTVARELAAPVWLEACGRITDVEQPSRSETASPASGSESGSEGEGEAAQPPRGSAVLIQPIRAPVGDLGGSAAVLMVPSEGLETLPSSSLPANPEDRVRINGLPVGPGMHVLRHADRLELGSLLVWLSADARPETTTYDPQRDGETVFCARTKVRLAAGDEIVRCPSVPGVDCDLIYRASAWEAALKCHGCGFDRSARPWSPPSARRSLSLEDVLAEAAGD